MQDIQTIPLSEETQRRYLNYALSVITSRALPDVRDGLKPVQRRIIYTMFHDLRLLPDGRHRKCAKVVGDVMGNYHPHGDMAIYDALVRMAQDFSLRYPLVDGKGNFGSLDGDAAASMRYTECKLQKIASELIDEIRSKTVEWRPNYDGTRSEPVVLPSKLPNLLINGTQGIAVGMATSIPPHNLGEVVEACIALVEDGNLESKDLLKYIKGPDFPTGGQVLASKRDLKEIYEAGSGTLKLRGEWEVEEPKGRKQQPMLVITSIPYGPTKQSIVEKIGEIIRERKLPQMVDVLDQSTTDVRIEVEIKKDADPALIMAYLYKNTALQTNVQVNLTCLVPTENPEVGRPERLNLKGCLRHFLDFRFEVVTRRLQFDLDELNRRIHILEGYAKVYDALDEVIRIIRKSEGKADAAQKLMKRFELDEEQVDAILELKLYRLARLEILMIQEELAQKKKEAKHLEGLLKSDQRRWGVVKDELKEIAGQYADKRKTKISVSADEVPEFDPNAYIVDEDANVVLTRDGWVKRVKELKDATSTRVREGDAVMQVLAGNTKSPIAFFTNFGSAYVAKIVDIPASTGYGDPVQKLFKFKDGERVVSAVSMDARVKPAEENYLAITKNGYGLRFAIAPHTEASTRAGRRFAKVAEGDEIVDVKPAAEEGVLVVVSETHTLVCDVAEVNILANPGRGVTVIKTDDNENVVGFGVNETLTLESEKGKTMEVKPLKKDRVPRGSRGSLAFSRKEKVARIVTPPPSVPQLAAPADSKTESKE
jgi:DNA gyrase subunit A